MKDTNAIEKALQVKVNEECTEIVENFIADLNKLANKYGGSNFYDFKKPYYNYEFMVDGVSGVKEVLHKMILDNHGSAMLKYKSKELINKLDII